MMELRRFLWMANVAAMERVVHRIEETAQRRAGTLSRLRTRVGNLLNERRQARLRLRREFFPRLAAERARIRSGALRLVEQFGKERNAIRQIWANRATRRDVV